MPDLLDYGQIEPILLTALLRKLGTAVCGLTLDSFNLYAKLPTGDGNAPGQQFVLVAKMPPYLQPGEDAPPDGRDFDRIVLDPVFLYGFTDKTARGPLTDWCMHRIVQLWAGRTDPYKAVRRRLKVTRFGRMYGSGSAPEDDDEKLLCRLLGFPTQDEISAAGLRKKPTLKPHFTRDDAVATTNLPGNILGGDVPTIQVTIPDFDYAGLEMRVAEGMASSGGPSIVRKNAEADPDYCPYCMRCSGLVRMRKVGHMHWRCDCGAEHVEEST